MEDITRHEKNKTKVSHLNHIALKWYVIIPRPEKNTMDDRVDSHHNDTDDVVWLDEGSTLSQ